MGEQTISARRLKRLEKMCKELGIEVRWNESGSFLQITPEELEMIHASTDWA